jgi:hypothetical protein
MDLGAMYIQNIEDWFAKPQYLIHVSRVYLIFALGRKVIVSPFSKARRQT